MNVIGISGSPRAGGNTDMLLDCVLEGALSAGGRVEKVALSGLDFSPCLECGGCARTGACVLHDDLELYYRKIAGADAVVVATPIFFCSVSAQLKMMIDRFQCRWIARYVLGKKLPAKGRRKGVFLSVAGSGKRKYFACAGSVVKAFFATIGVEYSADMYRGGIEKKGDIVRDKRFLLKAFELGRSLV